MTTTTSTSHPIPATVTIVPDMDDNSDADSLASALFRDDLNSLAQLIIPSSILGVLLDDGGGGGECTSNSNVPKELIVTFDANETVEVKYDGLTSTIVSSHDAHHPTVPNGGRAVDSVTIVKDNNNKKKKKNKKKKRFLKERESTPSVTEVAVDNKTSGTTTTKGATKTKTAKSATREKSATKTTATTPKSKLQLPSFGLGSRVPTERKSRKSKWSSSASLMSYGWRPRRSLPQEPSQQQDSDNVSLTKLETIILDTPTKTKKEKVIKPIRKNGRATLKDTAEDMASIKSNKNLTSLLSFRKNKSNKYSDDPNVRDYASLDYQPSPVRRRRLLKGGKHRTVAHPLEEESPLAKTVSSTSITSSSSSPALPSIPVITHPTAFTTTTTTIDSSMAFFLPQWPAKLDDNDYHHTENNIFKADHQSSSFFQNSKPEEETASWAKLSLFDLTAKEQQQEQQEQQQQGSGPQGTLQEEEEQEAHLLRHVIVQDEPDAMHDKKDKNLKRMMAKTQSRLKAALPITKQRSTKGNDRLATVERFDSFYDGLVVQQKQQEQPKSLLEQFVVQQEYEFDAFQAEKFHETTMSLDRRGRLPERKRPPSNSHNRFSFRSGFGRRFNHQNQHHDVEPKAPLDSIEIPLLPKSDSAVACAATPWNPSILLCAAGGPHGHRHTSSNSVTSSLADDESLDYDDKHERQLLPQPLPIPAALELAPQYTRNDLQDDNEVQATADKVAGSTTRRSWFRSRTGASRSFRRGRSQPPVGRSLEAPFPVVREDYSMNDGSYHVLKIGGPK